MNLDGEFTRVPHRFDDVSIPRGPLTAAYTRGVQALLVKGLVDAGFTRDQIAQIIPVAAATIDRRLRQRV